MTDYKATPEQFTAGRYAWRTADTEAMDGDPFARCILELSARVETLEAAQQPPQDKMDRLIAIDRDDPANSPVATDTFRALCAELTEKLHEHTSLYEGHESELVARARAALAQPEPVLTRPECFDFAMDFLGDPEGTEVRRYVEELEAHAAIQPVPVSERLPGDQLCW
jgi:hypothetical protein